MNTSVKLKKRTGSRTKTSQGKKSFTGGVSTDTVMINIYNNLISDFQRGGRSDLSRFRIRKVKDVREFEFPCCHNASTSIFKQTYQLEKLFSRYTALDDKYTPKEVNEMTLESFERDNLDISRPRGQRSILSHRVITKARSFIREVLGPVDLDEIFSLSRFGKRASIGVPLLNSYLDVKMRFPISCTEKLIPLFNKFLKGDPNLHEHLLHTYPEDCFNAYECVESLKLSLVPKKYDKHRPIEPYTTVACLLSLGVGSVLRERLETIGLYLSTLQSKHRKLVETISKTGSHVTLDLSAASTRIKWEHVMALFPYQWVKLLKLFYVNKLRVADDRADLYTETFAGMGCGFTFPLQTLIFYSLIKAINELGNSGRSFCSAYGDDLIYPSPIHKYVTHVFSELGFKVNNSKTFATGVFRESCGEDCHNGITVRPFCPEGSTQVLRGTRLAAYLYKTLNGLLQRWPESEIPSVVHYLKNMICIYTGAILIVPPSFPDYSGLKSSDPENYEEWYRPVAVPHWHNKTKHVAKTGQVFYVVEWQGHWSFRCIGMKSEDQPVSAVYPYFWDRLRQDSTVEDPFDAWDILEDIPALRWVSVVVPAQNGRAPSRRSVPCVIRKGSTKVQRREAAISNWC